MANLIKLKRSATSGNNPTTANLELGELAINTYDGNLFFKKSVSGTESILSVATLTGTQSLSNKTLASPIITGTLTAGGGVGTSGQFLKTTGNGVAWAAPTLSGSLSDVVISSPVANQVLTWTGAAWINQDSTQQVASAIFGSTLYDMGYVFDAVTISEDEGDLITAATFIYDLGVLSFTGIISLNNLDQSVKGDYLGYSIIFGF